MSESPKRFSLTWFLVVVLFMLTLVMIVVATIDKDRSDGSESGRPVNAQLNRMDVEEYYDDAGVDSVGL